MMLFKRKIDLSNEDECRASIDSVMLEVKKVNNLDNFDWHKCKSYLSVLYKCLNSVMNRLSANTRITLGNHIELRYSASKSVSNAQSINIDILDNNSWNVAGLELYPETMIQSNTIENFINNARFHCGIVTRDIMRIHQTEQWSQCEDIISDGVEDILGYRLSFTNYDWTLKEFCAILLVAWTE